MLALSEESHPSAAMLASRALASPANIGTGELNLIAVLQTEPDGIRRKSTIFAGGRIRFDAPHILHALSL